MSDQQLPPQSPTATERAQSRANFASVLGITGCLGALLLWAYWPTLQDMVNRWSNDPQYSHGFLVPVFALIVLWSRKPNHPDVCFELRWWGVGLILFGCSLRFAAAMLYFEWLDIFSLLPTLCGVCALLGGLPALRWAWPGIAFLIFMMPAPYQLETALAFPLQRLATVTSTYLLQTFGYPAICEGNVILLREHKLGVVEACSGLGMLVTFFALSTAVALIIQRSWVEKTLVFLSAVPIALVTNIVRITLTGILYVTAGSDVARVVYHDLAGWLMMPLALFLLWIELRFLTRLFLEAERSEPLSLGLPLPGESSSPSPPAEQQVRQATPPAEVITPRG